jgi:TetR/AcrR family transcriptional regulator, cholesterol catabolism regulator
MLNQTTVCSSSPPRGVEVRVGQAAVDTRTPRRAELVRAAARLFSERGYHGTSMQHLADALGLQRGSLYAHIGSKEELLLDVVEEGAERFLERGAEAAKLQAPAGDRLRHFLAGHIATVVEHLDAATVFLNEWRYLSPDLRAVVQQKRDSYEALIRGIIEEGKRNGEFREDADTRIASLGVLSVGNWIYAWYRPEGELGPQEIGEKFADLLVTGLEAR